MRITANDKQVFVRAIMQDVPKVDYDRMIDDISRRACIAMMPPALRDIASDPQVSCHLMHGSAYIGHNKYAAVVGNSRDIKFGKKELEKMQALAVELSEQNAARKDLRGKLESAIAGVNTRKQLQDLFPEFEKYLPAEAKKEKQLPAVAGVIEDIKRAGWPKGAKNGR